jgi:PAS domain S-box-containing protein
MADRPRHPKSKRVKRPAAPADGLLPLAAGTDQLFRLLVQGVIDYAIFLLDPNGIVTTWNRGAERMKGYLADEIIGQHFSRFYTEEDRAAGLPQRALRTATETGRFEHEGWRVRKDGTRFWASVVIDPIRDAQGELVGFAKITRDMTEKKVAQDALEATRAALAQSQKMEAIGQLTGGVAHDFNNLLTVITNALDLLARPLRDEAQKQRVIDGALRAAERGARLTQQLLAFARRQPLRPETHDVNRLIAGFEAVLRRACTESIVIEMELAPGTLAATVDAAQFETSLLNLVVNSRDAMPNGGQLRIATGRETANEAKARKMSDIAAGEVVVITVQDTGTGMSRQVVDRAFEPFFTTKEVGKGSGLGLSQVYGFIAQSGGHVEIDSQRGKGTTVRLYFPASTQPVQVEGGSGTSAITPSRARVLVVEDDPEVLDVTVATLNHHGYEVLTAPDAPSALEVLRRDDRIDILFTDIVMPNGMNGVELARRAVQLRPQVGVLLASGYPAAALSTDHAVAGDPGFAFIGKPYRSAELLEKLQQVQDDTPAGAQR